MEMLYSGDTEVYRFSSLRTTHRKHDAFGPSFLDSECCDPVDEIYILRRCFLCFRMAILFNRVITNRVSLISRTLVPSANPISSPLKLIQHCMPLPSSAIANPVPS